MNFNFSFLRVYFINFFYEIQSPKRQAKIREKRLKKLLKKTIKNNKYYQNLYKGIDIEKTPLCKLPSVNKIDLMEHFDDWVSDKDITKKEVLEFVSNPNNIGKRFKHKYMVHQTSGSTGSPMTVLHDNYAHDVAIGTGMVRNWAGGLKTLLKFYSSSKFVIKGSVILPFDIFSISSQDAKDIVGRFPKMRQKNTDFIDVSTDIDEIVERLNKHQPDLVATYPTYMKMLCNYQRNGKLNISPKMITTVGECLTYEIRKDIEDVFKCLVFTTYACTETASITHECLKNHHQHLNEDWIIIEPIDEFGNVLPNGVLSHKCYITNLSNYTQPLIRYELTDRIIVRDGKECGCGDERPWIEVEGRSPILLKFVGDNNKIIEISSISVSMAMHKIGDEIELYQFIVHEDNEVEIRLRLLEGYDKEIEFEKIKKDIGKFLEKNKVKKYNIVLSKEEPKFEKSGKFKEIYQDF